jgi:serine/threonine-protein kinase RsbT
MIVTETMSTPDSGEISIRTESDIVAARRTVREAATVMGFGQTDVARIVTAASELARNVFRYAGEGLMRWSAVQSGDRLALEIQFIDHGPGIADISLAMTEGYSTGGGLGMGLPGAKRLADELEVKSAAGTGTTVILRKWRKHDGGQRS